MRIVFIILFMTVVLIPIHAKAVTTIALINENFSATGVASWSTWSNNSLSWVWSKVTGDALPSGTEAYNSAGSGARGMPASHGGFEVFSISSSAVATGSIWQVAVTVVLPTIHPATWNGNTISFDMGYRTALSASSFELYNLTDSRSLLSQSITGSVGSWSNYSFNNIIFTDADAGDTLQLRWKDAAAASIPLASGLQVGAVVFNAVPESSALSLFTFGLGGLAMMRRRRL